MDKVLIHEEYDGAHRDLASVRLRDNVDFAAAAADAIAPICLPDSAKFAENEAGSGWGTVAGWGHLNDRMCTTNGQFIGLVT